MIMINTKRFDVVRKISLEFETYSIMFDVKISLDYSRLFKVQVLSIRLIPLHRLLFDNYLYKIYYNGKAINGSFKMDQSISLDWFSNTRSKLHRWFLQYFCAIKCQLLWLHQISWQQWLGLTAITFCY